MTWIAIALGIGAVEDIGGGIIEVFDRVTETGADRRKTEDGIDDGETEGAP